MCKCVFTVYRHFGPRTVWSQDTSAPSDWCRSVWTFWHQCWGVSKTVQLWYRTVSTFIRLCFVMRFIFYRCVIGHTEQRCNFIRYYSGPLTSLFANCIMTLFVFYFICVLFYVLYASWVQLLKAVHFALILAWTIITTHTHRVQGDARYLCSSLASCSNDWSQ